jgi:hypothetical protein
LGFWKGEEEKGIVMLFSRRLEDQEAFCDMLADLIDDQAIWSRDTFGHDDERGPTGPLKHLAKEAQETIEAIGTDEFRTEMADCFLLLLDASRRGGMVFREVVQEAVKKMEVNKSRTWQKPTSDEPVEHVRG